MPDYDDTIFDADALDSQEETSDPSADDVEFICPTDGKIPRDEVVFLCNNCRQDELIYQNGIYMCPSCLRPGHNFECMRCESKEVKMVLKSKT
jgi:hypothetical protein